MRVTTIAWLTLLMVGGVVGCHKLLGDYTIEPGCSKGAKRCYGNALQTCNAQGAWDNFDVCGSSTLCTEQQGTCLPPLCAAGERRCEGAKLQLCNANRDGWTDLLTCASAARCSGEKDGGSCTDEPCAPGAIECNGSKLRSCLKDSSAWDDGKDCGSTARCNKEEHTCLDAKCDPGEYRCEGAELQVCNQTLLGWTTVSTCESAVLCDNANHRCGGVGCTSPGAFSCDGKRLQKCSEDLSGYVDQGECATEAQCDAVGQKCSDAPCAPGARQCSGAKLQVCRTDQSGWDTAATCESDALCQQTVSTGAPSCVPPACEANATRCMGAQPEVCNAGRSGFRSNGSPCATPDLCSAGSGTCGMPVCQPGSTNCRGAQPVICNQGLTDYVANGAPCASVALCNPGMGTCGDSKCAAGQLRCDPLAKTHLQHCNADLTDWETTPCDICDTEELCSASLGAPSCDASSCQEPACDAGDTRCAGTGPDQDMVLETCNSGRTGYTSCDTCATAGLCSLSLKTQPFACTSTACTEPSCALTDRWCGGNSGNALYQCPTSRINTDATVLATCVTAGLCQLTHQKNETTCEAPTCAVTDRWCGGSGNKSLYQCPASRINSDATVIATCVTNGLCELTRSNNKTTCEAPKCAVGETKCGGSGSRTLQMCNSERTGFNDCATCSSAALCTDSLGATTCNSSACLICSSGDARCNAAGNYETCRADQKGWTVTDCGGNGCDETLGGCLMSMGGTGGTGGTGGSGP
jgi:hypothetical protein